MIQIGNAKIYTGDCIEVMQGMPDESVDLCITSPPWNIGKDYGIVRDDLSDDEYNELSENWLSQLYRISREGSRAYVIISDKLLFQLKPLAEKLNWKFVQILTWCKPNLLTTNKISGDWNYTTEQIMLLRKGKRTPMNNEIAGVTTHSYFVKAAPQSNFGGHERRVHVAQFPVELPKWILSRTLGQKVIDPFMGAGSVGIACEQLNRDFIGIELNKEYVDLAKSRIMKEASQEKLNL